MSLPTHDLPLLSGLVYRMCPSCGTRFAGPVSSKAKYCSERCRSQKRAATSVYVKGVYLAKSGRREHYDSSLERNHMIALDRLKLVWTKQHGIAVRYFDPKTRRERTYLPDFVVTLPDGTRLLQEGKPASLLTDPTIQAKAEAARRWCARHGMQYVFVTRPGQLR